MKRISTQFFSLLIMLCWVLISNASVNSPSANFAVVDGVITFDVSKVTTACGVNSGEITVTNISGGTAPYTVTIQEDVNETDSVCGTAGTTFSDLKPTYYSLKVTDNLGVVEEYGAPVAVQSESEIMIELETTNPLCYEGSATLSVISVSGGEGGEYLYSFDGGSSYGSETSVGWDFPYNQMFVYVKNEIGAGCAVYQMAKAVMEPDLLELNVNSVIPPTCIGAKDGNIELEISGGTMPYFYSVNGGASWEECDELVTIKAGAQVYNIRITDANDCSAAGIDTTIMLEQNIIVATLSSVDLIECFGTKDKTISVEFESWATETGDTGNSNLPGVDDVPGRIVSYWVDNGMGEVSMFVPSNHTGGKSITLFGTGSYAVWVTDIYNCSSNMQTLEIIGNPEVIIEDVYSVGIECYGAFDVPMTIVASGGDSNNVLEYAIANNKEALQYIPESRWFDFDAIDVASGRSSVTFNVGEGEYWVAVRNGICVVGSDTAHIVEGYNELLVNEGAIVLVGPDCVGSSEGSITIPEDAVTGGAGGYTYTLKDAVGGAIIVNRSTMGMFDGLPAGSYSILVEDMNMCPSYETGSIVITNPEPFVIAAENIEDVDCFASETGQFKINVISGGVGSKYYAELYIGADGSMMTPMAPASDSEMWKDNKIFDNVGAGIWAVWAMSDLGCVTGGTSDTDWLVEIEQNDSIEWDFHKIAGDVHYVMPGCNGASNGEIHLQGIIGGVGKYNAMVVGLSAEGAAFDSTYMKIMEVGGIYRLGGIPASDAAGFTVTVMDTAGCVADWMGTIVVEEPEVLEVSLELGAGAFVCPGSTDGLINAMASGGTSPYEYQFVKDGVIETPYQSALSSFTAELGVPYVVQVRDANGCGTEGTITVEALTPVTLTIMDVSCFGATTATAMVTAMGEDGRTFEVQYAPVVGGVEGVLSTWMLLDGATEITSLAYGVDGVSTGDYNFYVRDNMGCTVPAVSMSFTPVASALTATVISGTYTATVSNVLGGTAPYLLFVNGNTMGEISGSEDVDLTYGSENEIKIIDAHNCEYVEFLEIDSLTLTANPSAGDEMAEEFDVVLTFNREVVVGENDIAGGDFTAGTGTTFTVTMTGANMDVLQLQVMNTILDLGGNAFVGETFTYTVQDVVNPVLETKTPDEITITDNHPEFVLTFSEDVVLGDLGNLYVTENGSTNAHLVIPITSEMIVGNTVTVTYEYDPTIGGLATDIEYFVQVDSAAIKDANGNAWEGISDIAEWTFTTGADVKTSIGDELQTVDFKVYPNPFNNFIKIDNFDKLTKIIITDITGRKVIEVENPEQIVQTDDLVSGLYFVSMYVGMDVVKASKLVKR